jgi:hypothetical protein
MKEGTMSSPIDRAAEALFPDEGAQALNVKFFCAGDENVSVDALAEIIVRADSQVRHGTARLVTDID